MLWKNMVLFMGLLYAHLVTGLLTWSDIIPLSDSNGVVHVTQENYEWLSNGAREFYSIVLVTSSKPDSHGQVCRTCESFWPVWNKIAWTLTHTLPEQRSQHFLFFEIDTSEIHKFVEDMGLVDVPRCLVYPPGEENELFSFSTSLFYEFQISPELTVDKAVQFADFLGRILNVFVNIREDFNLNSFLKSFASFILVFVAFKKICLPLISNRFKFIGCVLSLLGILISITGYKFTKINGIPFISKNEEGQIMFFAGSTSWQFGIEILTVSLMYCAMAICLLLLIWVIKTKIRVPPYGRILAIIILDVALFNLFSYFLECYKIKLPSYPYLLL
ncbi:dolichyl-diphosphooligosaccharide--protein glycotransferase Ecym_4087 [Eremothecium cymbalariae DBVPG|uniref:Dolichyl-diphosphooligosaccharide--protein glycosyltransferase subunit OST6 n=1 Tax=Eremothecium cymbalariae (strain CBS 270.75 / DBVPG 7215 / KCTC 17166 / NRRL Y-17582) TaxID=931890 RepID=G8JT13_ERECY|nr:hypothetical protein Ecym_4087 [Eremothecium cymbalariae DBVPG\